MLVNQAELNIVRAGSYITYSSLKEIGNRILESFCDIIIRYDLVHHELPIVETSFTTPFSGVRTLKTMLL